MSTATLERPNATTDFPPYELPPQNVDCALLKSQFMPSGREPTHPSSSESQMRDEVSIFHYYSVPNEIAEISRMRREGIGREVVEFYVAENAVTFGLEYAGLISHTSIGYSLGADGSLLYEDIKMRESYERLAESAGPRSREEDEFIGYSICESALGDGASSAVLVSPPHEDASRLARDGYGLTMAMIRAEDDPNQVRLHIFRYREQVGSLETTKEIASALQNSGMKPCGAQQDELVARRYGTEAECRTNPLISHSGIAELDFARVLSAVGTTPEELRESAIYEAKLRQELEFYIASYTQAVMSGDVALGERALSMFFNAAKDLKEQIARWIIDEQLSTNKGYVPHLQPTSKHGVVLNEQDHRYLQAQFIAANDTKYNREATTQAGGSCPSSSNKSPNRFDIDAGLRMGMTPENLIRTDSSPLASVGTGVLTPEEAKKDKNLCQKCGNEAPHFHCPDCSNVIVVGSGTSKCSGCGKGKTC